MYHRSRRFGALLPLALASLFLAMAAPASAGDADPAAWRAAQEWLGLVDNGKYQESWNQASRIFQRTITAQAWAQRAAAAREQAGRPIMRELIDTHTVVDPPDLPAGEYLRIRYECECSAAGVMKETVMMVREAGRGWRVVAYSAQPARAA